MNFLPIENLVFKTRLKPNDVIQRLSDITDPREDIDHGLFSRGTTRTYQGQISGEKFQIKRIILYRNDFLPRIKGTLEKDLDGTTLTIKMRPPVFALIFIGLLAAFFVFMLFAVISYAATSDGSTRLAPLGMPLFMYAILLGAFKLESIKSKKYLLKVLDAEIVKR